MESIALATDATGFVLRITREDTERKLFVARAFYVGVRRNWSRGSRAVFVQRMSADMFVGCGTIERLVEIEDMEESEKQLCMRNNWYGKVLFEVVVKFLPPVSSAAAKVSMLQTGEQIAASEIEKISAMALTKIIS